MAVLKHVWFLHNIIFAHRYVIYYYLFIFSLMSCNGGEVFITHFHPYNLIGWVLHSSKELKRHTQKDWD